METTKILHDFFEKANIAIHLIDSNGIILYANKAELNLFGFTEKEYIGQNFTNFYKQENLTSEILAQLSRDSELDEYEAEIKCKDGAIKTVRINSSVRLAEGRFMHTWCFTRDITHAKKVERYLRLLNNAGAELSTAQDTPTALDKISKFILENFADWFIINELRSDGYAHLLKMAHKDPNKVLWAERYRVQHPIDLSDPQHGSVGWVMRTGQASLVSNITDEIIEKGAKDDEQRALLKELSIKSVMIIPMKVKGTVSGVISFISCNEQNKYTDLDFDFAQDFTNRIAVTLNNTILYEEIKKEIAEKVDANRKKDEFISIASHELKTPSN